MRQLSQLILVSALILITTPAKSEAALAALETKSADQVTHSPNNTLLSAMQLGGYIKYMNTAIFNQFDEQWMVDNLYHSRLNLNWQISPALSLNAGMRNRFMYGDYVSIFPGYKDLIAQDDGILHFLTQNIYSGQSALLTNTFDRLNIEYTSGRTTVTVGRQRINWGQTFVWNPNDIFNTYSFLDFDYEERPGSDGVRLQVFPGYASVADLAMKVDKDNHVTAAALYRFSSGGYDIQFLAGFMGRDDYVAGTGFTGNISNLGVSGEATWFHPQKNAADSSGILIASAGVNYLFSNSLSVTAEGIYNGYYATMKTASFTDLYLLPLSAKTLSFSKFSWFSQVGYPLHPLLNMTFAAMYLPSLDDGFILLPSLTYSASNNLDISLRGQSFSGTFANMQEEINMIFIRFRYSF